MASSRSRAANRDDGQTSGTSSKSVRTSRRQREAAASESARNTPDIDGDSAAASGHYHNQQYQHDTSGGAAFSGQMSSSGSNSSKKVSPLETNSMTYTNNEFLAGKPSGANPVQRKLAIELLGKATVVAIEENGLCSQPASVAQAIVEQQPAGYGATPEIENLPVEALRKYRAAYKLPVHSAQTFKGYLLDCPVGRKTWSYRYGASGGASERSLQVLNTLSENDGARDGGDNNDNDDEQKRKNQHSQQQQKQVIPVASSATSRISKQALAKVVKRSFASQSIRESEVIVDFIYSTRTQSKIENSVFLLFFFPQNY